MVSILSNVSSSRKQSLFQVEVCKKEKVWYVVTILVNTICNGILVSCVSVRGINVLIIKNTLIKKKKKKKKKKKLPCDIFKNKCRLYGGTAERKKYFFSDAGKSPELKRIVFKLCEIVVSESDELPKYCCRSCCDKVTRLNRNIEAFASTCKAARKF